MSNFTFYADPTKYEEALRLLEEAKAQVAVEEEAFKLAILAETGMTMESVVGHVSSAGSLYPRATYTITKAELYRDPSGSSYLWLTLKHTGDGHVTSSYHYDMEVIGG